MLNNIKIYFINLDRSIDRRTFMEQQFKEAGVEYLRIPAVDGKTLDKSIIKPIYGRLKVKNEHYTLPKVGELGIYFSQMEAWKRIVSQEEDFALVLEDDVLLDQKLFGDLDLIIKGITPSDIVDISSKKGVWVRKKKLLEEKVLLTRYVTPSLGIFGILIGKKAAQKLLDVFPEYTLPVDNMLQQVYKHKIPVWTTNRAYVRHNDEAVGGSTIQIKEYTLKTKLTKEILRPFYRLKIIGKNLIYGS